ncbi:MAG TPA: transporter substrate-binding domain-containing protein [Anaerolineae bacterium]|nr:transporter substrate-binding domain-containing protein [Anaerolineae bacterium]HMR65455.1 transporter substrate-binding domain-containing protein [Anaerolineae bacterium]
MKIVLLVFVLGLSTRFLSSCTFPQDPHRTLDTVRGGTLRVGLVDNAPWAKQGREDQASGVEVDLVNQMADDLDAEVNWVWGLEQDHMTALENFELDLVIGGLTQSTPWQAHVGLTKSYFENEISVGVPPERETISTLDGQEVAVEIGAATAAYLEKEGAIPVRVLHPEETGLPVAAAAWQLESWGFQLTEFKLHEEHHVLALPPGENAWLTYLEDFLTVQQFQIREQLIAEDSGESS